MMLFKLLGRARRALATAGPIRAGLALSCVATVLYAAGALGATIRGGGALHLAWDAGLLLLGATAAVTPERTNRGDRAVATTSNYVARTIAVVIGLVGIMAGAPPSPFPVHPSPAHPPPRGVRVALP